MLQLDGKPVTTDDLGALALVNYGHFTSMRVEAGRVRGLDLHLARLARDCRSLFGTELDTGRVRELARRAVRAAPGPVMLRVTIFDPHLGLARPVGDLQPRVLTSTRPVSPEVTVPVRLGAVRYLRELPEVKHVGLLGSVRQRRVAQHAGFDDALFVTPDGLVSEGPTWNIGFVVNGRVSWPAAPHLPGVTMRMLTDVARRAGIDVREEPVPLDRITGGYGAFITNANIGLRPVASVNGVRLRVGADLVERLRRAYDAIGGQPL